MDETKYICPVCGGLGYFSHIVDSHKEFWDNKYTGQHSLPSNIEEWNQRFAAIGLGVIKYVQPDE